MRSWTSPTVLVSHPMTTTWQSVWREASSLRWGASHPGEGSLLRDCLCVTVGISSVNTTAHTIGSMSWTKMSWFNTLNVCCLAPSWNTKYALVSHSDRICQKTYSWIHFSIFILFTGNRASIDQPHGKWNQAWDGVHQQFYPGSKRGWRLLLWISGGWLWRSAGAVHWIQLYYNLGLVHHCDYTFSTWY